MAQTAVLVAQEPPQKIQGSNIGRDLTKLPVIGPEFADCARCELKDQCDKGAWAPAYRPQKFNGLMFVGEGAGSQEIAAKQPFVGRAGQLLRALCDYESVGLNRDECSITNSTLCMPRVKHKALHIDYPNAIYSCLPRLEREIELVRPRVIVALGAAALISLTGYEEVKKKRIPFECTCNVQTRRVLAVQCTARRRDDNTKCDWYLRGTSEHDLEQAKPGRCPKCDSSLANQKPKFIKCPLCKGLKTKEEEQRTFEHDFNISDVAGGIFHPDKLASRLDEFGVKYIIPTYHPAFLLRPPPEHVRAMAGQFAVEPVLKHLIKAKRLLTEEQKWDVRHVVTTDPAVIDAYTDFTGDLVRRGQDPNYAVDIETEAFGIEIDDKTGERKEVQLDATNAWLVSKIKCIGIGSITKGHMLVVDTREAGAILIAALKRFLENPARRKTMQNGMYDYTVIRRIWGIDTKGYVDDTQTAHHALYPDEDLNLAHQAFCYTESDAWKPPRVVKGVEVHGNFDELALYNAKDVYNTDVAREAMGADNGRARPGSLLAQEGCDLAYEIDMVMQRIAVRASWVGLPVDLEALNAIGVEGQHKAAEALYQMRKIINDPIFNPASNPQLVKVLFDPQGPLRLTPTGKTDKGAPSTAKDDLVKLSEYPFVQALLRYRESDKIVGTFVLGEDIKPGPDGRMHPNWKVHGTVTGRWSSSPNCFSGDTEVLTREGWKRFDACCGSERIAQWSIDGAIAFVEPTAWIKKPAPEMVALENDHIDLLVTPDHRCLLERRDGTIEDVLASDYVEDRKQLNAGFYRGGDLRLTEAEIALYCAVQADGSWSQGHRVYFKLAKQRKIDRLLWAARECEIDCRELSPDKPDSRSPYLLRRSFSLGGPIIDQIHERLGRDKLWGPWLLDLTAESRALFLIEVFNWDGCYTRQSHYSSSIKNNADWVQALFVLHNKRANVRVYHSGNPHAKLNYQVDVSRKHYSWTTNISKSRVAWSSDVYCVSVPSSYILVRRNGKVMITGQCQNWPKWIRACIVAPKGRKIVGADFSQLELRILAALCNDTELIRRCMNADESRKLEPDFDPHSYVASLAFKGAFTELSLKDPNHVADKKAKCKCETCTRKALRDIAKRVIYGLNYGAGAATVLASIYAGGYEGPPVTLQTIERTKVVIFKAFEGIPKWRDGAFKRASTDWEVRSPILGRRRVFPLGDVSQSVVYNYPIQCAQKGTRVLTRDGYVAVETVTQTHAWTGAAWQPAQGLSKAEEQIFELVLATGARLGTNAEHKLLVLPEDVDDFVWRDVAELRSGDHVAQPLVRPLEFGRYMAPDAAYWLGYWIGNGYIDDRQTGWCFGTRIGRFTCSDYATRFVNWLRTQEWSHQKPQESPNLVTVRASASSDLYKWLQAFGIDSTWSAHTKRIPELIWRVDLEARQAFILGLLDADGTLANDPPNLHMCNRELLADVQLLARSCGLESRLHGPYGADRQGHISWRLTLNGSLLRQHLGYGVEVERQRFSQEACLAPINVREFIDTFPRNPFSYVTERSFYILWSRLRHGGSTNPHTLDRMWRALDVAPQSPIYTTSPIIAVARTERWSSMHTLIVNGEHRYDSAGIISKNSGAADIINSRLEILDENLRKVDPTADLIAQVHDAVYFECAEHKAKEVASLVEKTLSCEFALVRDGTSMLFPASAAIAQNWKDAA